MEIEKEILARMRFPFQHAPEELQFHKQAYRLQLLWRRRLQGPGGDVRVHVIDEEIRGLILRRVPTGELGRAAEEAGMIRLRYDVALKAVADIIMIEEVLRTVV